MQKDDCPHFFAANYASDQISAMNHPDTRLIARVFSRPLFEKVARTASAEPVQRYLRGAGLSDLEDGCKDLGALYRRAYSRVSAGYRNEYFYKSVLIDRIIFKQHNPKFAAAQIELPVGRSICDLAVFNGTSTAYEIKTEFDSPRRLVSQTPDYQTAFDRVVVVAPVDAAERYLKTLSPSIGIIGVSSQNALVSLREPLANAANVTPRSIFRCLRQDEYIDALRDAVGVDFALMPSGSRRREAEETFANLCPSLAHDVFLAAMRARTTGPHIVKFLRALPQSLRVLGYETNLSSSAQARFLSAIASPLH